MKAKAGRKKWKTKFCIGKWLKRYFKKRTTRKSKLGNGGNGCIDKSGRLI